MNLRRPARHLLPIAALVAMLLACSTEDSSETCGADFECSAGFTCVAGQCQAFVVPPPVTIVECKVGAWSSRACTDGRTGKKGVGCADAAGFVACCPPEAPFARRSTKTCYATAADAAGACASECLHCTLTDTARSKCRSYTASPTHRCVDDSAVQCARGAGGDARQCCPRATPYWCTRTGGCFATMEEAAAACLAAPARPDDVEDGCWACAGTTDGSGPACQTGSVGDTAPVIAGGPQNCANGSYCGDGEKCCCGTAGCTCIVANGSCCADQVRPGETPYFCPGGLSCSPKGCCPG